MSALFLIVIGPIVGILWGRLIQRWSLGTIWDAVVGLIGFSLVQYIFNLGDIVQSILYPTLGAISIHVLVALLVHTKRNKTEEIPVKSNSSPTTEGKKNTSSLKSSSAKAIIGQPDSPASPAISFFQGDTSHVHSNDNLNFSPPLPRSLSWEDGSPITLADFSGDNYFLGIGIDQYQHYPKLSNPVHDIQSLFEVLTEQYGFNDQLATFLFNAEATKRTILETLRTFARRLTSHDSLILYFAGHGVFDKVFEEGYWVPYDAQSEDDTQLIPNSIILKAIRSIDCLHTFLISDACFSGTLLSNSRSYADRIRKFPSRWALCSGREELVSDGVSGENSPFAHALITYLKQDPRTAIRVKDLINYVEEVVANNSDQTPFGNRLQQAKDQGGEFIFLKQP